MKPGVVYLLHFDAPYKHARHYIGWTEGPLVKRLQEHAEGRGARLMSVIRSHGIGFELARVWGGTRQEERRLKKQGGASRICPICRIYREKLLVDV